MFRLFKFKINKKKRGQVLIMVIFFAAIAILFIGGLTSWAGITLKAMRLAANRELAIQIAESGVEYYRWHLAHAPQDFKDGTGLPGPYIHNYTDKDGNKIGQFSLTITAPPTGSTVVKVRSVGSIIDDSTITRTLEVKLAIPSWAKYAVAANDNMRFGSGTEVFGPIHSNQGIHFDGLTHNIITSALASYVDPDYGGSAVFGVYTRVSPVDPLPPNPVPARTDVFQVGRQFPIPAIDFSGITADLAKMKTDATAGGRYFGKSNKSGYHVVLKTNGTFDLYKVTRLQSAPGGCTNTDGQTGWGTWSINTQQLVGNYAFPANGIIFLEDNVWVDGSINNARLTIAAGTFPYAANTQKSITVNNNLTYTNYDGKDALSLIAQGDINVGFNSADNLRIDGALIAQNGRAGRYYYSSQCPTYYIRQSLTLYGMIGTNIRYGFAYTNGTGYQIRNIIYDANLLYAPPPEFPLTTDQYQIISWQEIK